MGIIHVRELERCDGCRGRRRPRELQDGVLNLRQPPCALGFSIPLADSLGHSTQSPSPAHMGLLGACAVVRAGAGASAGPPALDHVEVFRVAANHHLWPPCATVALRPHCLERRRLTCERSHAMRSKRFSCCACRTVSAHSPLKKPTQRARQQRADRRACRAPLGRSPTGCWSVRIERTARGRGGQGAAQVACARHGAAPRPAIAGLRRPTAPTPEGQQRRHCGAVRLAPRGHAST